MGFWKSGMRYASRGEVCRNVASMAARSQPSSPSGSPIGALTRRAPPRRSASIAFEYTGDSIMRRSPGRLSARAMIAMADSAPEVITICSGVVGRPRCAYIAATRARSAGSPEGR